MRGSLSFLPRPERQEKQERERRENAENAKQGVKKASASELRLQKGELAFAASFPPLVSPKKSFLTHQRALLRHADLAHPPLPLCLGRTTSETDISELNLPKQIKITFPNGPDKLDRFDIVVSPDEGYYK